MIQLLFQSPLLFAIWVMAILTALSVHEFSHALASTALGDSTAKRLGRLTLNPFSHVDPLGFLALVTVGFGWGKPVPYNPYNLKDQKWGPVIVALAGPAMNLVFVLIFGLALRLLLPALGEGNMLVEFLRWSVFLNAALLFFNLIPLPPLDGSKLLIAVLHDRQQESARFFLETRGPWILIGLVAADMLFNIGLFSLLFALVSRLANLIVGL